MITERCNYCQKDTETLEIAGGDCKICGFSKPTPKHLHEGSSLDEALEEVNESLSNKLEMIETFEQLEAGHELILSEFSFGEIVSMKKSYFDKLIGEINESRMKNGNLGNGVEFIVVSEDEKDD